MTAHAHMHRFIIVTFAACSLIVVAAAQAQEEDLKSLPPELQNDPWLRSLPNDGIVVGDLEPKYGDLGRAPKPEATDTSNESGSGDNASGAPGSGGDSGERGGERGTSGDGGAGTVPGSSDAGVQQPAPAAAQEAEPNDKFGDAQRLATSASVSAQINPAKDVDWYSFEAPRRGIIEVTFSNMDPSIDIQFQVHDPNNYNFTGWLRPKLVGSGTETMTVDLTRAGRYYLVVNDRSGKAAAKYAVTWQYRSGDRYEPNESFGSVTRIARNTSIAVSTLPLKDTDYFSFEVPRRGVANITFKDVPDDLDLNFQVHDPNNYNFTGWIKPKMRDGSTETQIIDLNIAGRYYLVVADSGSDGRSATPYTLELSTDLADAHEPNDALGKVVSIPATGTTTASLLPIKDYDWFGIDVKHPGQLEVAFEGVPVPLGISFKIHSPENYNFTGWIKPKASGGQDTSDFAPTVIDLATAGRYYLIVAETGSDARDPKPFKIKTKYTASDAMEPNNDLGTAKLIALGKPVQANILPLKDYDWFAFDVASPGTIHAVVSNIAGDFTPSLQIHTKHNYNATGWKVPRIRDRATEAVTLEAKEAGRYYVIIADSGHKHRITEPYTLTVTVK